MEAVAALLDVLEEPALPRRCHVVLFVPPSALEHLPPNLPWLSMIKSSKCASATGYASPINPLV